MHVHKGDVIMLGWFHSVPLMWRCAKKCSNARGKAVKKKKKKTASE